MTVQQVFKTEDGTTFDTYSEALLYEAIKEIDGIWLEAYKIPILVKGILSTVSVRPRQDKPNKEASKA